MRNPARLSLRQRAGLALFSRLHRVAVERHELRTLFWECTLRCNLRCRHCGSDCTADGQVADMPAAEFFRVLDGQITPHVDPHRVMVVLSGGEVLLREDIDRIGHMLFERGYPWGLVTNGMALDACRLDELMRAGLHAITVSLDGMPSDHNALRGDARSFERAVRAIALIAREPTLRWDVVTCVTPGSLPGLERFRAFLIDRGVRDWRLQTIFPAGRATDDQSLQLSDAEFGRLMEFIRATRRENRIRCSYGCEGFLGGYETRVRDHFYHCTAGVSTASIRIDGSISGCTSIRANYAQGNIYRDDFWQVWTERFAPFRRREWMRQGACADCAMFRYCLGGGMHLRDDRGRLALCSYRRLRP